MNNDVTAVENQVHDTILTAMDNVSSRRVSRSGGRGGGWMTPCIKIGYSEPRGAESREGSSTLAESSRVT